MTGETPAQDAATAVVTSPAEANVAVHRLRAAFPEADIRAFSQFGQDWAVVPSALIAEVCLVLRDDPDTQFNMLVDVTAADLLPRAPRWEVVYQLLSLPRNARFRLKVEVQDGPSPEVPSVTAVFRTADFFEREIFDLMGIGFLGHPNLRRLLLPDDWQGHPLRFDHPLGGEEVGFTS